jgi:hypothetical protein
MIASTEKGPCWATHHLGFDGVKRITNEQGLEQARIATEIQYSCMDIHENMHCGTTANEKGHRHDCKVPG